MVDIHWGFYPLTKVKYVIYIFETLCRDGGLKRGKVKDTFKEEQQKLYSKMLVGTQEDRSRSWRICRGGPAQNSCLCWSSWTGKLPLMSTVWLPRSLPQPGLLSCIAVMGHTKSAALCWNSSTEASLALEMKTRCAQKGALSSSVAVFWGNILLSCICFILSSTS